MLDLWLVRHAESLGNLDKTEADTSLSPRGRAQAADLARALVGESFDRAYSSPLLRARETASIALPGHSFVVDPRLRELVVASETFLDVSRLSLDQIRALAKRDALEPVETGKQFMARVQAWLGDLPTSGRVIAFTHFAVLRECLRVLVPSAARVQVIEHAAVYRLHVDGRLNRVVPFVLRGE